MHDKNELINTYRNKFGYYNEDTLKRAVIEDPQLVIDILRSTNINGLAKAYGLLALCELVDDQYYDYIKSFISHPSPYVRETVFMGISGYYHKNPVKYNEVKYILQTYLHLESNGVKSQIESCLDNLDFYVELNEGE